MSPMKCRIRLISMRIPMNDDDNDLNHNYDEDIVADQDDDKKDG